VKGPTTRQRMVLQAIDTSIRERGFPPTFREIAAALDISSTNAVHDHLVAMDRKGYIRANALNDDGRARARAITITPAGRALLPVPARETPPYAAELAIEALDLSA
jgi:SOS-response transcriptional repressor LexA